MSSLAWLLAELDNTKPVTTSGQSPRTSSRDSTTNSRKTVEILARLPVLRDSPGLISRPVTIQQAPKMSVAFAIQDDSTGDNRTARATRLPSISEMFPSLIPPPHSHLPVADQTQNQSCIRLSSSPQFTPSSSPTLSSLAPSNLLLNAALPTPQRSWRPSSEQKYICQEYGCGKVFFRKHHLVSHLVCHTEGKPFICPKSGCEASFRRNQDMRRHLRNVKHQIMDADAKSNH